MSCAPQRGTARGQPPSIEAKVVTCDPQFGNRIAFVKMLPEDGDKLVKFIDSAAPSD